MSTSKRAIIKMKSKKPFMKSRKGQITVFIVVGIILLFSTATVLYIKNKMTEKRIEDIVSEIQDVPVQVQPVRNFVDQCLSSVSKRAIKLIGMHGGYIDIPCTGDSPSINYTNGETFDCDIVGMWPTESEAVQIWPGREGFEDYYIPYWLYMSSENEKDEVEFKWAKPSLVFGDQNPEYSKLGTLSIEEQIVLYVENNIDDCLAGFARFSDQGFNVVPQSEPEAFVVIAENNVVIAMTYDLDIEDNDGDEFELNRFRIIHDVQLKHIYDTAFKLLDVVTDSKMFEKTALNIIAGAGDIDGDLPPAAGMELSFYPSGRWILTEVQEKLQFYLQTNLPLMRVYGAHGTKRYPVNRPYDEPSLYNKMFLITGMDINPDFGVSFQYFQDWPIYLHIYSGQMISTSDELTFPLFLKALGGIFQYNTPYDLSYPVRVQLTEADAFKGEGYTFNFFYESNMRDNTPVTAEFNATPTPSLGVQQTMSCEHSHRNSANITVEVTDVDGKPLKDATIHFGARELCLIGRTTLNEVETKASLRAQFPIAAGNLKVSRFGYMEETIPLITSTEEKIIHVKLTKMRRLPKGSFSVRVYDINKEGLDYTDEYMYNDEGDWEKSDSGTWRVQDQNRLDSDCRQEEENNPLRWVNGNDDYHDANISQFWVFDTNSPPGGLKPNETLIISLERKKESPLEPDIKPVLIIEYDKPSPPAQLVPGEYSAHFTLIRKTPLIIPECKGCIDVSGCDWDDMDAIEFGTFPEGEFKINITIPPGLLYSPRGLEFGMFRLNMHDVPEEQRTSMDMNMWKVMKEKLQSGRLDPYTSTDYALLLNPTGFALSPEAIAEELESESLFD